MLLAAAKVRSLAIKCYDDQLTSGWQAVQRVIKDTDVKDFHIIAIRNYKDLKEDVDSPFIEWHIRNHTITLYCGVQTVVRLYVFEP